MSNDVKTAPFPGLTSESRLVDGVRLHAFLGGNPDGKTIVLVAGFPQDAHAWHRVAPQLADTYRLVIADLPGQGESDRPADGYDTRTMATRLHGLLEQLDASRNSLVAHDVGAWTAFPYGLLFDDDIDRYTQSFAADGGIRAGLGYYRAAALSAQQNHAILHDHRFTMPVLGVSAEHGSIPDMAAPVRPYADDARSITVPGTGHFIPEEQPELLAQALRDFIG